MPGLPIALSPLGPQLSDSAVAVPVGGVPSDGADSLFVGALLAALGGELPQEMPVEKPVPDAKDPGQTPSAVGGDPGALVVALMQAQAEFGQAPAVAGAGAKQSAADEPLQQQPATLVVREGGRSSEPVILVATDRGRQSLTVAAGKELPLQPAETALRGDSLPEPALRLTGTDQEVDLSPFQQMLERSAAAHAPQTQAVDRFAASTSWQSNSVAAPVGSPDWAGAVGQKVVWLAGQKQQVVELQLNPPHLGPLEVKLTVSNEQASAVFSCHSGPVREAIETALPRLREMFAENGIMLGNVTVGAESFSREQDPPQSGGGDRQSSSDPDAQLHIERSDPWIRRGGEGLVDIFA